MNGRSAKALRKVFKAKQYPQEFNEFKRALRHSDPEAKKQALNMARKIAYSGKEIHVGKLDVRG